MFELIDNSRKKLNSNDYINIIVKRLDNKSKKKLIKFKFESSF